MATAPARLANQHRGIRRPAPPPAAAPTVTDGEKIARGVAAIGLLGVGLIHLLDVVDKFDETAYIGVLYLALIGACVVASRHLIVVGDRRQGDRRRYGERRFGPGGEHHDRGGWNHLPQRVCCKRDQRNRPGPHRRGERAPGDR